MPVNAVSAAVEQRNKGRWAGQPLGPARKGLSLFSRNVAALDCKWLPLHVALGPLIAFENHLVPFFPDLQALSPEYAKELRNGVGRHRQFHFHCVLPFLDCDGLTTLSTLIPVEYALTLLDAKFSREVLA
jgi:hypothetical protein